MASSQVEISSSSSPFGCVLRDHNRRREPNVTATHVARFRNNLKTLVMDRLNDCMTITPNQNQNQNPNPILANFRVPKTNHNTTTNAVPRRSDDSRQHTSTTNDPQTQTNSTPTPTPIPIPETGTNKNQTSKLGASSLVQIWEKRLNVSSSNVGLNANANATNATVCSGKQETETEQEQEQEQACSVEAGDFEDERYDAGPGSEDGFADWHSSRTSSSSPPSSTQSQSSDAGERERVRVVDIIRRLTLTAAKPPHSSWVEDHNDHPNESSHPTLIPRDQVEPRCLSHILCSPRIRGRQAFADLLLQIERDRQRELDILVDRRAVSKFPQRGRIQSLLRLKILKRGMALEDEQKRPQFVITPRENHRSSSIMHLRERFSGVGENSARSLIGEMLNNNDEDKNQSHTNAHTPDPHATNVTNDKEKDNQNHNDNQQVVVGVHSTSIDNNNQIVGDFKEEQIEEQEPAKPEPEREQEQEEGGSEVDPPSSEGIWQDRPDLNLDSQDSIDGWEAEDQISEAAEESYGADYVGTSYDWFSDISRPRSYWEDRRQSWYQQMLESNSANDEIRQLIERKTVSNFLSSDFRERMDKLMVTRLERQTQQEEEYEDDDGAEEEEMWCFSEGHTQPKSSDNEEEDDERSLISAQYHEASDYLDQSASPLQLASPSILSSWSYQLDNEMGEDSNRGASTSSPQPFQPQFSSNNQQRSSLRSTTHHPSIEMELIYDLRGHMEQLYQEMSELRKSIKCCMAMQLMLQHSIKRNEVGGGRKSRKPKCCICYNMQIDSLLYRCGHMCSCMKCAKELQWRGGKCPVCRAPIEDVVRASFTTHS